MRTEKAVVLLAFLLGIGMWIIDAVFDYLWFFDDTFLRLLILAPPAHEVYIRLVILVSFTVFGVVVGRLIAQRARAEQKLRESEERLRTTVLGTSASTGPDLYLSLVWHLAAALDVKYALVGRLTETDSNRVRTLAVWNGDSHPDNFEYDLTGTPCENVMAQRTCYYPHGVRSRFPQDTLLVEMGADSYFGTPVTDSSGNTVGLVAVLDDKPFPEEQASQARSLLEVFTVRVAAEIERQQHEAERDRLFEELAAQHEELEQFTYTVSHDLKSPIITISSFIKILEDEIARGDSAGIRDALERVTRASSRMGELVEDLLTLSRVGRVRTRPEVLDLGEVVSEVAQLVSGLLREAKVDLVISPDLPTVQGSRTQFVQLLQNLIENAVKYMGDQAKPQIEVSGREIDGELVCSVRDTGIGIKPDYHERVFRVFEKLDPKSEGTGIGLALAKRTVSTWGGRIWIESEGLGTGTTVCFTVSQCDQPAGKTVAVT
jgi:signal transduction histidine kinase